MLFLCSLSLTGCNDLFDIGDTEKTYSGPDVVAFKPLQAEVTEGSSLTMEVQLISANGLASSDISVSLGVDGESTAEADQYTLSSNSVTIASGSAIVEFTIDFPSNTSLEAGEESTLILNITDSSVGIAEELDTTTIFITGT